MYNIDFLPQLEAFRRHLFGFGGPSNELYYRYSVPSGVKILECEEDSNCEWVPKEKFRKKNRIC